MLNRNKHRLMMYKILVEILRDTFLTSVLGFKGGTACYFFYNLPRFSVDLDFDIISKEINKKNTHVVYSKMEDIFKRLDLKIKEKNLKRNTIFFLLSYKEDASNIKIEISRRDYPNIYEIKDFYGFSINVLTRADIFAHKLAASMDRKRIAFRDFFDIHFFLKQGWPVNEEIILLRTGTNFKEYLKDLKSFIVKNINSRNVLQGLGEVLDIKQKAWVKKSLKKELISLLDFYA